jgi:hypothetical protein
MTIIRVLKIVGAVATIVTGVISIFWPLGVRSFTGLEVQGGRGVTEIRAVLGTWWLGRCVWWLCLSINPSCSLTWSAWHLRSGSGSYSCYKKIVARPNVTVSESCVNAML